jgi:hypothetical protein
MGVVLVFAAGYVMGTQSRDETMDDVVKALRAIRESDEFHGLMKAVKQHAAGSLRGLAGMLERMGDDAAEAGAGAAPGAGVASDLLDRVRFLAGSR